jgi:hypothetical protein
MKFDGTNPYLVWDSQDYWIYDRSANELGLYFATAKTYVLDDSDFSPTAHALVDLGTSTERWAGIWGGYASFNATTVTGTNVIGGTFTAKGDAPGIISNGGATGGIGVTAIGGPTDAGLKGLGGTGGYGVHGVGDGNYGVYGEAADNVGVAALGGVTATDGHAGMVSQGGAGSGGSGDGGAGITATGGARAGTGVGGYGGRFTGTGTNAVGVFGTASLGYGGWFEGATGGSPNKAAIHLATQQDHPTGRVDGDFWVTDTEVTNSYEVYANLSGETVQLSPIKAWATINVATGTPSLAADSSYNIASVGNSGQDVNVVIDDDMANTTYCVQVTCGTTDLVGVTNNKAAGSFDVSVYSVTGGSQLDLSSGTAIIHVAVLGPIA